MVQELRLGTRRTRLSSTIILRLDDRLLLIKRKKEPFKGYWALVGGAKRQDESFTQCAVREAFEEVGIKVRGITRVDEILVSNELGEQFSIVYLADIRCEDEIHIGSEVEDAQFYCFRSLPTPIVPFHKEVIDHYFTKG